MEHLHTRSCESPHNVGVPGAACQGQGTCCCPTTGSTQRQARAAPNHRHRQHPTAGTGREEAATTTGASPRRATGTEKHPFPGQSQASPSHGTEPNRQWAMGKRQTKGKSIPGRLDSLPDCQTTDTHAGATGSLHHNGAPGTSFCSRLSTGKSIRCPPNGHGHPDLPVNRQDPTTGSGRTQPWAQAGPDHEHGQRLTTSMGRTQPWAQPVPDHGHGQCPTTGMGSARPRARAPPDHGHRHHLTTGTGKTRPWIWAVPTTGTGTGEAAIPTGATPQWATGT